MCCSAGQLLYEHAMRDASDARLESRDEAARETAPYQAPGYESISLACEISAYAPDSGDPLF